MAKGKGKGTYRRDNLEGCGNALMCIVGTISLIIWLISLAMAPDDPSGNTSAGTSGSDSPSPAAGSGEMNKHACAHDIVVPDGRNETQECGGDCVVACGPCNPRYDGCVGTKYCPLLCAAGALCNADLGFYQPEQCTGRVCRNNACADMTVIPCSANETAFHLFMTALYGGIAVVGIISYLLATKISHRPRIVMFGTAPAFVHTIVSGSFLTACSVGEYSVAEARFITQLIFGILTLAYTNGFKILFINDGSDSAAIFLSMGSWTMFMIADTMLSSINAWQNVYYATNEEIFPEIASNKKCGETEYLFFVLWTTIMGFVCFFTFLFVLKLGGPNTSVNEEQPQRRAQIKIFISFVGIPSIIFMLINISFLGACKNAGHTVIREYGITTAVFYALFVLSPLLFGRSAKAEKYSTKNVVPNSSDTASYRRFALSPYQKVALFTMCSAMLNGWSGYIIYKNVQALK